MFAIIMPVVLGPAIVVLIRLDRRAKKDGTVNMASSASDRRALREQASSEGLGEPDRIVVAPTAAAGETRVEACRRNLEEIDAFGLVLLGFGWALLLLPFSLKTYAHDGWKNPSMIAMMVVGGLLLVAYAFYEISWARFPSMPRRLLFNRTFVMAIIIDTTYMCKLRRAGVSGFQLTRTCQWPVKSEVSTGALMY